MYNFFDRVVLKLISLFGTYISKHKANKWCQNICKYADHFRYKYENVEFDLDVNGEMRVIQLIGTLKPKTILDVGANIGQWTSRLKRFHSDCIVHTFEPIPHTYKQLLTNTEQQSGLIHNNFGLSSEADTIKLHFTDDIAFDSASTAYPIQGMKFHEEYYTSSLDCTFKKASDYIVENKLDIIDFIKIDVEGMEYKVLEGLENKIENVRAIQFEYGIFNISSKILLLDLCNYFEKHGFVVGKIYPHHVEFFTYHFDRENFLGNNYIAVKKDETDFIEKLKIRS
ncbi:MAG: FkbM family methyltransferase [Ghiorsea sp.]